jgi:ferredoxin
MRFLERALRRLLAALDAAATWLYGSPWNPIHQSGTVAVAMLAALVGTGLYLVFFYRVGAPFASVARLAADPWLGAWIRTLHRYTSDVFIVAAVLHLARMLAQARSWGPRTLAWVSGLFLLGTGIVCAWTGFVMVWDAFGERLAREGARLLDALPVLSEPTSRIFAGDTPVPSAFFFVNLFFHIVVPLAMGAALWLHVSRLARPTLFPPRRVTWIVMAALTVTSIAVPAALGAPADPARVTPTAPADLVVAWWLPFSERLAPGVVWLIGAIVSAAVLLVPRWARRERTGRWAPSAVDPRLCTGCTQCAQDCPWEVITMVARDDGRAEPVASVNPSRCVSCGICAGSCAPMGVGPPGRTGRDQLAALRDRVLPEVRQLERLPVVAVVCEQTPRRHVDALRSRGVYVHGVTCVGNLHSSVVEWFIRAGATGVLVGQCPPRDCRSREGPKWLMDRLYHEREAELQERVDRRRVRVATLAPGDLAGTLAAFEAFGRDLASLERPRSEQEIDLDLECEPAPAAGGVP